MRKRHAPHNAATFAFSLSSLSPVGSLRPTSSSTPRSQQTIPAQKMNADNLDNLTTGELIQRSDALGTAIEADRLRHRAAEAMATGYAEGVLRPRTAGRDRVAATTGTVEGLAYAHEEKMQAVQDEQGHTAAHDEINAEVLRRNVDELGLYAPDAVGLKAFHHQSLGAFKRHSNINEFAPPGDYVDSRAFDLASALDAVTTHAETVKQLYGVGKEIFSVAAPLTGVVASSLGAFERGNVIRLPPDHGTDPLMFFQSLMTPAALAYLEMQAEPTEEELTIPVAPMATTSPTPLPPTDDSVTIDKKKAQGIKDLRDISLIHFFETREREHAEVLTAEKSGTHDYVDQDDDDIASLVIGGAGNAQEVVLWNNDTVISWYMMDETFQSQQHFTMVETALHASTAAWNRTAPGGVKFVRATVPDETSFKVRYAGPSGNREASAFFPTEYIRNYSIMNIYERAMDNHNSGNLSNVLLHELGHVLGLRHSFRRRDRIRLVCTASRIRTPLCRTTFLRRSRCPM